MLDEETQRANFSTKWENGAEVVNEAVADNTYQMLESALEATRIYHEKSVAAGPLDPKVEELIKPAVEKLTASPNHAVRDKAKVVLEELGKGA
jgi:hypothetical protein